MKKVFMTIAAAMMAMFTFAAATEVNVQGALTAASGQADGWVSTEDYAVTGFVTILDRPYSDGKQYFYMDDNYSSMGQAFEAYKCTIAKAVTPGAKVKVTGKLKVYKGLVEISEGTVDIITEGDPLPVKTVAQAVALAEAIADPNAGKTNYGQVVVVRGYVTKAFDVEGGKQSAWLADLSTATKGDIQAYKCAVTATIADGDFVEVYGQLAKFINTSSKTTLEVTGGSMIKAVPSAVENVTTVEPKAIKVMENGQLYILRDGVKYNAAGVVVE